VKWGIFAPPNPRTNIELVQMTVMFLVELRILRSDEAELFQLGVLPRGVDVSET
jgi:hypothetical protein